MDPFVRRLIERLHHPSRPLSRNRHFHTFDTPEGRRALRTSRRLRALQGQILACHRDGGHIRLHRDGDEGAHRIELSLVSINGRCVSHLLPEELELLADLPGVREVLALAPAANDAG